MLRRALQNHGVDPRQAFAAELVFEELASNVVRHAGGAARLPGPPALEVAVELRRDELILRLEDDGGPFDPFSGPPRALPASLEQAAGGGLGLILVRKAATRTTYERRDGRNCVVVAIGAPSDSVAG